jgi:hypothetical protein
MAAEAQGTGIADTVAVNFVRWDIAELARPSALLSFPSG